MVCLEDAHKMSLTAQKWETYRFTSKEFDRETGLYYYGARYYEPKLSNWMSVDPSGFELINPMDSEGKPRKGYNIVEALNWYAYAGNNPVIFVDPTGESATAAVISALGVDAAIPEPTDVVVLKWVGWGALLLGALAVDALADNMDMSEKVDNPRNEKEKDRDIDDIHNPDEWPENPDDWNPPDGITEDEKAKDATDGRHRHWKNEDGKTVRRWDKDGRESGKDRGPHWHDGDERHVPPGGGSAE